MQICGYLKTLCTADISRHIEQLEERLRVAERVTFDPAVLERMNELESQLRVAREATIEECARVCESTRNALEENRAIWEENPHLMPDDEWIEHWESSACRGEEFAATIRAKLEDTQETIDGVLYLCVYEGDGNERTLIKKTPASEVRG